MQEQIHSINMVSSNAVSTNYAAISDLFQLEDHTSPY